MLYLGVVKNLQEYSLIIVEIIQNTTVKKYIPLLWFNITDLHLTIIFQFLYT